VLVVEKDGQTLGILPLIVRPTGRFGLAQALAYPLDSWGNFYGPIGPDGGMVLEAGLDHVRRTRRDWQFLELSWVDSLGGAESTEQALARVGYRFTRHLYENNAVIDLAAQGSWEAYLATRSSNFRKDVRKKENRLAKRGAVTFVIHRPLPGDDADPRWDLYDACTTISSVSWQDTAARGNTLSKNDADRDFYHDCHQAATRLGCVETCVLHVDGRPVAFQYSYHCRGFVSALRTAYDPEFAHEGAGAVNHARTVANCFAQGDHTFDMGPLAFKEYKTDWLTGLRPTYRYTYFPPTVVRAQLIRGKRMIESQLRSAVRKWRAARNPAVPY
jgi:CelD/BcsL family acetyltransferase involved in cellulose biosynthesis